MHQLLERLEQPNPECASCEGKGLFGLTGLCCPLCWNYHYQTGEAAPLRSELVLMCSMLSRILERRHNCPGCGGSGMLEGLNKCYCSTDADVALRKLTEGIERCNQEMIWLTEDTNSPDELVEEVLGV